MAPDDLNNHVHINISSDISPCKCQPTLFLDPGSQVAYITLTDHSDELLHKAIAKVLGEEQSEQELTIL